MAESPRILENEYCLILLPYTKKYQKLYNETIKPTIEKFDLKCMRPDEFIDKISIINLISDLIRSAKLIIADVSTKNINIFYEIGYCDALGKDIILISKKGEDISFDLRHRRIITYDDTKVGLKNLQLKLKKTIPLIKEKIEPKLEEGYNLQKKALSQKEESPLKKFISIRNKLVHSEILIEREKLLRLMVEELFMNVDGFNIEAKKHRAKENEIDFVIWNDMKTSPFKELSNPIIVECKAKKEISTNDIRQVFNYLEHLNIKYGIIITTGDINQNAKSLIQNIIKHSEKTILTFDINDLLEINSEHIYRNLLKNKLRKSMLIKLSRG